jgi:uncharacterized protein (TIGR03032 family)
MPTGRWSRWPPGRGSRCACRSSTPRFRTRASSPSRAIPPRPWILESGKGELCVVDLDTGRSEPIVELPGFTRGLAMTGTTAFVGLSQIRESSTFGDLPLTRRLQERMSGVWLVDLAGGSIEGFLRFEDLVQEVFDVALLPGTRWPEIAEPGSSAVATSYVLP